MVYIKYPNFKTGIAPSAKSTLLYKMKNDMMTPTDKLTLAKNRIWGNLPEGGNKKNGYQYMKRHWTALPRSLDYYKMRHETLFPDLKDWEKKTLAIERYEYRKMRVEVRDMKVGGKKGTDEGSSMTLFNLK